jgi:hypothetical protein
MTFTLYLFSDWSIKTGADLYFSLDADVHLTNSKSLKQLVRRLQTYNLGILSPMVAQSGKLFSNFWGAVQG